MEHYEAPRCLGFVEEMFLLCWGETRPVQHSWSVTHDPCPGHRYISAVLVLFGNDATRLLEWISHMASSWGFFGISVNGFSDIGLCFKDPISMCASLLLFS